MENKVKRKPSPSSAGQYIYSRSRPTQQILDPYDVTGVYRTQSDIDRAIKNKNFDHAKCMKMNYTTKNIYWLCHTN